MTKPSHRPQYHLMPPANWMNDPNGVCQWRGQYHVFYQHNPYAAVWGPMHWGHAVSRDLVHWTHLPIALAPTPDSPDEHGCWSGCLVNDGGVPRVIYTAFRNGVQLPCLATGGDDLIAWQKYPGNPVIAAPPREDVSGFRDHCLWRESGKWYHIIGSGINGVGGVAFLYRSADLVHWEYVQPLCVGDVKTNGEMWECPDFFSLGGKHILLISALPQSQVLCLTGAYAHGTFTPEAQGVFDPGCLYAPQTFVDEQDRRLLWGWLREERGPEAQMAAGWSGVMSLPYVLELLPDGTLGAQPAPELQVLRGQPISFRDVDSDLGDVLAGVKGTALEIRAEIDPGEAAECGLRLCCSPNGSAPEGAEQTRLVYDRARRRLILDRLRSSQSAESPTSELACELAGDGRLSLRVFLDHSVVEVFANGRLAFTGRIYPTRADSTGLGLFASGGRARVRSLDVWEMHSIW